VLEGSGSRLLEPANRPEDHAAAAAFRGLRDGSGPWYARGGSSLPYATVRGQRRDWLIDVWDGPGHLIQDRVGQYIEGNVLSDAQMKSLASSFEDIPWTPWVGERYSRVDERFYRDLGAFLRICTDHGLSVSFAKG